MAMPTDYVAAGRLNRLRSATLEDEDARKSGPFVGQHVSAPATPAAPPEAPSVDVMSKFKKPGTDTQPHTTGLNTGERSELFSDIDMAKKPDFEGK